MGPARDCFAYLPSCIASPQRLRVTSAQASTAPCRVCRSGLCVMDSRRGKTAKDRAGHTSGEHLNTPPGEGCRTEAPPEQLLHPQGWTEAYKCQALPQLLGDASVSPHPPGHKVGSVG